MCGYRSYGAIIAEWGHNYGKQFLEATRIYKRGELRVRQRCPNVYRRLNQEELERKLGHWAEGLVHLTQAEQQQATGAQVCVDGKSLRGGSRRSRVLEPHTSSQLWGTD
ncbi:MAG: hypothetical protein WKF84_06315 [Pyrinomonadaceae bacterium]